MHDIILLNKTDLVAVEQIDFLESYIHTVKQEPELFVLNTGRYRCH